MDLSHHSKHESHIWAKMTYGTDRRLTKAREMRRARERMETCAKKGNPGKKQDITASQINPFKRHILTHVELEGC